MSRVDTPLNHHKAFWIALFFSLVSVGAWEIYWRSKGRIPDLSDDKFLWAETRARVDNLDSTGVVLAGSSRTLFSMQLAEWEKITGILPVQLATAGGNPIPVAEDIIENTDFKGTLILGVTPGIFFAKIEKNKFGWRRNAQRIKHFYNQTYAQRLNHVLSIPLQNNLSFLSASEEEWSDDIDLKSLLREIKWGTRLGNENDPPFYSFQYLDRTRNTRMSDRCARDTAFSNSIKRVWYFFDKDEKKTSPEEAITYVEKLAKKFIARGGNLILFRAPSTGFYKELEAKNQPRKEYWDVLVQKTGARGYHYDDYVALRNYDCPEWSHLSGEDADTFTRDFIDILLKDNVLSLPKKQ